MPSEDPSQVCMHIEYANPLCHTGRMAQPTDRTDRIRELRAEREKLLDQAEQIRQDILAEVRASFPAKGEPPRGTLTRLVAATGWTRAYVANIRDGKVT